VLRSLVKLAHVGQGGREVLRHYGRPRPKRDRAPAPGARPPRSGRSA